MNRYLTGGQRFGGRRNSGVASVEFALGFMLFWLLIVAWVEISIMSYISAISDLAISEASRAAKKETQTYISAFYQVLNDSDSIWKNVVDKNNFTATVQFVGSMNELMAVTDTCVPDSGAQTASCGVEEGSALAIYSITYDFETVFTFFLDESVFSREVIVVQEYERDQFQM